MSDLYASSLLFALPETERPSLSSRACRSSSLCFMRRERVELGAGSFLGFSEHPERRAGRFPEVLASKWSAVVGGGLRLFGEVSLSVGSTFLGNRLTIRSAPSSSGDTAMCNGMSRSMLMQQHCRCAFEAEDSRNHRKVSTSIDMCCQLGFLTIRYSRQTLIQKMDCC